MAVLNAINTHCFKNQNLHLILEKKIIFMLAEREEFALQDSFT